MSQDMQIDTKAISNQYLKCFALRDSWLLMTEDYLRFTP
jgi:hypothetical protein